MEDGVFSWVLLGGQDKDWQKSEKDIHQMKILAHKEVQGRAGNVQKTRSVWAEGEFHQGNKKMMWSKETLEKDLESP